GITMKDANLSCLGLGEVDLQILKCTKAEADLKICRPWAIHNLSPPSHQPCRLTLVLRWVDATSATARRPR
ncbi:hypothetical protein J6590_097324, partial [Homalodisca vitripennis]